AVQEAYGDFRFRNTADAHELDPQVWRRQPVPQKSQVGHEQFYEPFPRSLNRLLGRRLLHRALWNRWRADNEDLIEAFDRNDGPPLKDEVQRIRENALHLALSIR